METIERPYIKTEKLPWLRMDGQRYVGANDNIASLLFASGISRVHADIVNDVRLPNGRVLVDADGAIVSENVVTPKYQPIQLSEIADNFLGPVIERYGALPHSVARSESGFEVIALSLARYLLAGHEIAPFVLAQHTHGRTALRFSIFEYRLICANGAVGLALSASSERILHLKNATRRMEAVAKQWDTLMCLYAEYRAEMKQLSETPCNVRNVLNQLYPVPDSVREQAKRERLIDDLAYRSRLADAGAFGETLIDVYNAVTHRLTHRIQNARESAQWGESMLIGARASTTETVRKKLVAIANGN